MSNLNNNTTQLEALLAKVNELPEAGGGTDTSDATATASDILSGKTAYVNGEKITGNIAFQPAQTITPTTSDQTIASNIYLGGTQTIKGDVNLVADNIVSGKSIFGVVGTATAGEGGDTSIEDSLVTRTVSTYSNDRVRTIGNYAFYSCSRLTSVSFPVATTIGNQAFYSCSRLTSVSFPVATTIGGYAFNTCISLTSVSFPAATTISINVFNGCRSLTSVSFPKVLTIGNYAFNSCISLTSVSFPVATTIGSNAFNGCFSLTSVSFPAATTIGSNAFNGCRSLTSVSFPAATTIGSNAFNNCSRLTSIYLMASYMCILSNSNAFSKTGIWSNKGSIFVPSSLVAAYKDKTNWVFFSKRIFGI